MTPIDANLLAGAVVFAATLILTVLIPARIDSDRAKPHRWFGGE
jgi:hypothetical protein